ncbi:bifunctional adenosylcobinamide kinase/adenosylcobinamide-phosphate guanylyltransferase [Sphingomonas sp. CGMCC 1.13654]|uniref:Bifunctional adenosylcobalamin biosynthesis protein n=1 Tax=Sphingomonas chungangi TaxID=2683589 RepID=A0A838KZE5_9SPHN|nr:bifunctional adenosylcobinamide kinase/adenosylcobinamide-phosphate guanylyltransferase [Sphingomonas chungangi]MBA2932633.1 bifunctional adenosylcobinamide kinase/adenosylcobinamide-phosphate guanylyltransferase [Sphingomonas chungangi]MVW56256.1 bifunctional adenosylcobinamide kinase/adenosylcobinamide-phosphate guanylyltransferase [Sphingomonas chungangi]
MPHSRGVPSEQQKLTTSLFLGGARSGKSRLAQAAAEAFDGPLIYVATAEAGDAEMAARIAHHRADRGDRWTTVECRIDLADAIAAYEQPVLVDCLTLWLSNLMLGGHDVAGHTQRLIDTVRERAAPLFLVSNEVGLGLVPETPLGRAFRDEQGRLNQSIAAVVDHVTFVAAGLPLRLK